jgi:hypothetical protein
MRTASWGGGWVLGVVSFLRVEPVGTQPSPNQRGRLEDLVSPETDNLLAAARERALQRLLEATARDIQLRAELDSSRRRDFLRTSILGLMSAGALGMVFRRVAASDSWGSTTQQPEEKGSALSFGSQISAFTWDNILFQVGSHAFAALAWEHELSIGNATLRNRAPVDKEAFRRVLDLCKRDPSLYARVYGKIGWFQPALEEVLFRILPSVLCPGPGAEWLVGIPTSLAFAGVHNLVSAGAETKRAIPLDSNLKLSLDYIPLTQFLLGAFCWYTARRYGELAPVVAHVFNNQASAISVVLGGRKNQQRYEQFLKEEVSRFDVRL